MIARACHSSDLIVLLVLLAQLDSSTSFPRNAPQSRFATTMLHILPGCQTALLPATHGYSDLPEAARHRSGQPIYRARAWMALSPCPFRYAIFAMDRVFTRAVAYWPPRRPPTAHAIGRR